MAAVLRGILFFEKSVGILNYYDSCGVCAGGNQERMFGNMRQSIETNRPEETYELGRKLGREAQPGEIYCLNGDLGTGKTVFAQGFAQGLGIAGPVNSPTFTILQVYEEGRLPLYHFDVYRIADPEEMEEIGYRDYFFGAGVCLIEWAEQIEELIPSEAISVTIRKELEKGFDYREIVLTFPDERERRSGGEQ